MSYPWSLPGREQPDPHEAARYALVEAVEKEVDRPLPGIGGRSQYPVSTFLGECSSKAQAVLFKACHLAMIDRADLASAELKSFVNLVAEEYADDHPEEWR